MFIKRMQILPTVNKFHNQIRKNIQHSRSFPTQTFANYLDLKAINYRLFVNFDNY